MIWWQGLAEGADVLFEVELLSFDRQPHMSQLSAAQCMARALVLKNQGNVVFAKVSCLTECDRNLTGI